MTKKKKEENYYYETSCPYTYGLLKEYAKENRKHMTDAEKFDGAYHAEREQTQADKLRTQEINL